MADRISTNQGERLMVQNKPLAETEEEHLLRPGSGNRRALWNLLLQWVFSDDWFYSKGYGRSTCKGSCLHGIP